MANGRGEGELPMVVVLTATQDTATPRPKHRRAPERLGCLNALLEAGAVLDLEKIA